MITVLTAAYGEDTLQAQPEQSVECKWIAVTDHDRHPLTAMEKWEPRFEPRPHLSPRMAAKIPKYLPALYVPVEGEVVLWLDGAVKLTSPHAVDRMTSLTCLSGGMSMIPHPDRSTVQSEWPHAVKQGRYAGQMIEEQARWYVNNPFSWEDDRLWATTVISQVVNAEHHAMGIKWLTQNCIWTAQDQLSLPWVAANSYVHIWPITLDLWDNPYFTLRQREKDV